MNKYEYFLKFWGEIENNKWVEKDIGTKEKNFWFETEEQRLKFKNFLKTIANKHNVIIVFAEQEGYNVRKRTIAKMDLIYNCRVYPYSYDFGYGYPTGAAYYMFTDGNYGCDCNRSLFLMRKYPNDFKTEFDCGQEIIMKNFKIELKK